jgi:hypothetical protein
MPRLSGGRDRALIDPWPPASASSRAAVASPWRLLDETGALLATELYQHRLRDWKGLEAALGTAPTVNMAVG